MPIIKKIYILPEDRDEFILDNQALEMSLALDDIRNSLRSKLKYEDLNEEEYKIYENMQNKFYEIINDRNINLDV